MEWIFPDYAGVTHLSSETLLTAAPGWRTKCHSTGGDGVVRMGLGLSHLSEIPFPWQQWKHQANSMKSSQTSKSYWMQPPYFPNLTSFSVFIITGRGTLTGWIPVFRRRITGCDYGHHGNLGAQSVCIAHSCVICMAGWGSMLTNFSFRYEIVTPRDEMWPRARS